MAQWIPLICFAVAITVKIRHLCLIRRLIVREAEMLPPSSCTLKQIKVKFIFFVGSTVFTDRNHFAGGPSQSSSSKSGFLNILIKHAKMAAAASTVSSQQNGNFVGLWFPYFLLFFIISSRSCEVKWNECISELLQLQQLHLSTVLQSIYCWNFYTDGE